ncbi:MAG: RidA family protein [Anaerolineales bacterium]|nr:RidA family protein [Anaerolineales bacterium]
MLKKVITSAGAPKAIGPYSVAVKAGGLIFTAGQLGINPDSGEFVGTEIEDQTRQALVNLSKVLESAGSSLEDVVKTTVFLKNMGDFSRMNEVYAKFFPVDPPARSAVEAAALPKDGLVEIEAVAYQAV